MKKETKEKLMNMKTEDVYSRVLFALFNMTKSAEYSSISELAYILDSKSLLNLLEYFGGTTIRIPTLSEFKTVIQALLLYQYVNIEEIEYNQALKLMDCTECQLHDIKECHAKLVDILSKYDFSRK